MSAIGIKLEGDSSFLDINDDTVIELTLDNPFLGDAEKLSPGSVSMPFDLPGGEASPKNAVRFKNPDVIANNEAYQIQKASLYIHSLFYKKGNLKQNGGNSKKISAFFTFGLTTIGEDFKTMKLRELLDSNVVIDNSAISKIIYIKKNTAGDVSIIVNGKGYSAANLNLLYQAINADAEATLDSGKYVPYATLVSSGSTPGGIAHDYLQIKSSMYYTYIDPFLPDLPFYIWQDSVDPLVELSVTVDPEEITNYSIESFDMTAYYNAFKTFLAGYISGVYPTASLRFPVMFNPGLYGDKRLKDGELINGVNGAGLICNSPNHLQRRNFNSIQPFIRLKWILEKIATKFGYALEGNFYTDAEVGNILVDNNTTLDVPMLFTGDKEYVFWRRSFNMNELVPDVKVVDFMKGIASRYNLGIFSNEATKKIRIEYREATALAKEYDDITSISSPVDDGDDQRIAGYTLLSKKEDNDKLSVDESFTIGTSEVTYDITCGRLFGTGITVQDVGLVQGPRTDRKIGDQFGLRVFHYKGHVNNGVFSYPAADISGADFYEALEDSITRTGLHSRCWKYWLYFQSRRLAVKMKLNLPFRKLLNFDWQLKRRFNRTNFLVKSLKVRLSKSGMGTTDAELITMK